MTLNLRPATASDAPALAALNGEVQALHFAQRPDHFKRPDPEQIAAWFRDLLGAGSAKLWLAELDGSAAGYALVLVRERAESAFCPARTWWEIDQMSVGAPHRRRGVARALVQRVVADARAAGVAELELCSWVFNEEARAAFVHLGFVPKVVRFELPLAVQS